MKESIARQQSDIARRLRLADGVQIEQALGMRAGNPDSDLAELLFVLGTISWDQAQCLREVSGTAGALPSPQTSAPARPPGIADAATAMADTAATSAHYFGLMPSSRYVLQQEIGRGGLGRVVEAIDRVFDRIVALKLLVEDADPGHVDRFRYEAQITGSLDHPHIVAVHDMGILAGSREEFFAMKRIQGENLSSVIAQRKWPLHRLIEAFRDIALALAYAHARGVIHRDLKPANVMLGEFGEVFVVDWGLAHSIRESTARKETWDRAGALPASAGRLTLAGSVIGTPQYMSPEQARGELEAIDERSDVYGLGAILYQILCGRPPFDGTDVRQVLRSVVAEDPRPPSEYGPVDAQLEAIALRALAKDRSRRFASARELANEIDAWLEGVRDLRKREAIAEGHLSEAARFRTGWAEAVAAWRSARREKAAFQDRMALMEESTGLLAAWKLEDRIEALSRTGIQAFVEADIRLAAALSILPGHRGARRQRADLYWERFLQAEEEGDERGMLQARRVLEEVDDGTHRASLQGDGVLSLVTHSYRCPCLLQGRRAPESDMSVLGWHPATGDRTPGSSSQGSPGDAPHDRLVNVHGEGCLLAELAGADVWFFRYSEQGRVQVPTGPADPGRGIPEHIRKALFQGTSFAPVGGGQYLGRTPLRNLPFPMGPGLLVVSIEGRVPAVAPVHVDRGESVTLALTLFLPGEIPASARPITRPASRSGRLGANSARAAYDQEFFVDRFPITCGEYAEFLTDLARTNRREAAARRPRGSESSDFYWLDDAAGKYSVPGGSPGGRESSAIGWRPDWPVIGVSWHDAMAFARWKSTTSRRIWCLVPEAVWQRSGQGEDGRLLPWGNRRIARFSHNLESARGRQSPEPIGSRPFDESPFGLRDMAGNVSQWCLDGIGDGPIRTRLARGGNWSTSHLGVDLTSRLGGRPDLVHPTIGFRLCSPVSLPARPDGNSGRGA